MKYYTPVVVVGVGLLLLVNKLRYAFVLPRHIAYSDIKYNDKKVKN